MPTIKGIAYFTNGLFIPKRMRDAGGNETGDPSYSISILIPGNDPQLAALKSEVEAAKLATFPSGFPSNGTVCLNDYDAKYSGKDYYDPRFSGYWVWSTTAKESSKPAVVDMSHQPILDTGAVPGGMIIWVNAGISGFTKGKGGVGGWLNGVMSTGEVSEFGVLGSKQSVDQMFAGIESVPTAAPVVPPAAPVAPPAAPVAPSAIHRMTAAANGMTRDQFVAAGWTDEQLITNGMMEPPGGVVPSFAAQQ